LSKILVSPYYTFHTNLAAYNHILEPSVTPIRAGDPYPCRIRIRYGYVGDTLRMRIRGVSASPRANRPGNWLSGTFRRVGYGPYPSHPLDSPMPYRIERAATPSVRTHEGDAAGGGWLPAGDEPAGDEPPATRHNPSRSSSPGEAATSSRTGGRRPSPQREGSWRPAPICKVRTPVRPFLLDLLFLLLDSHFPFLISRFHDFIQ